MGWVQVPARVPGTGTRNGRKQNKKNISLAWSAVLCSACILLAKKGKKTENILCYVMFYYNICMVRRNTATAQQQNDR
jgi:hypothetical protein